MIVELTRLMRGIPDGLGRVTCTTTLSQRFEVVGVPGESASSLASRAQDIARAQGYLVLDGCQAMITAIHQRDSKVVDGMASSKEFDEMTAAAPPGSS